MTAVSVLMPVYNAERYVAEAVESILAQTFRDFEFIIVDDGSTDNSLAILRHYAEQDDRIRLVSRENKGLVVSLNEMIGLARGDLIARMDADDVALLERFALQVAYLNSHPEVICLGGRIREIDDRGRILADFPPIQGDSVIQENLLKGCNSFTHASVMMRRDPLLAVGGYRASMILAEDLDLWLRLGEVGRLENLPQVVVHYRVHRESVSSRHAARQLEVTKTASDEACDRRGLPRCYQPFDSHRPVEGRVSRHEFALKYGWWSFCRGDRLMAFQFGLQSIWWVPWRTTGWRLVVCALLKTTARPS